MSSPLSLAGYAALPADPERRHRRRLRLAAAAATAVVVALAAYGHDYYLVGAANRPFSPKHALLKPGGPVGINLGIFGVFLFLLIFLYPLRKRVAWLARRGSSKHWLDFHVVLGLTAPVVIAFHSSFKFSGIAGMAFWIMVAVALSGIVGRYIYAQIPRSLSSAELSLKELRAEQETFSRELAQQQLFRTAQLLPIFAMPSAEEIRRMPVYRAVLLMIALDLARPFRIARLRARALRGAGLVFSLGGLLATSNHDLERIIRTARMQSALAKRIAFLDRSHRVFHLWHVIHRPFSYSFVVLALLHIVVVMSLGFL
jgi:hypothetical protein